MKAKGFSYCDTTVYWIGMNLLATLNLYLNALVLICCLGSKWHWWQKVQALLLAGISLNYLASCTSVFHWAKTLHKMLLYMLAFNFTEHPLVLLTLEKTKIKYFCHKTSYWHNSKNSLNKKFLPFLRQQYSIVI